MISQSGGGRTITVATPGFTEGKGANIFPKTAWNWKNLDPEGGVQNFTMQIRHYERKITMNVPTTAAKI